MLIFSGVRRCFEIEIVLETGKVNIKGLGKDEILERLVAYDRSQRNGAYISQINMITVSSFSGPNSAIWGYNRGVRHSPKMRTRLL